MSSTVHVTLPPTSTVTSAGSQHSFVSSHPGTEVPDGILTEADEAANEVGTKENNPNEIMKIVTITILIVHSLLTSKLYTFR